jgi:shikimate kinase
MGCGKSSVGREIAKRCRFAFVDTDQLIRRRFNKSIPEIFAQFGEEVFREQEYLSLLELEHATNMVLATGGGIVVRPQNRPLLKQLGSIVWLTADEQTIWDRVSRNQLRPLLHTADPRETMRRLIEERRPTYAALADVTVDSTGLTHGAVAERVLGLLRRTLDTST